MREILFRGKTKNGEWKYGDLIFEPYIQEKVILETVGQYTGLTDKNGKKIFEGDIVKDEFGRILEVLFRDNWGKFSFKLIKITGEKWTDNFVYADIGEWFAYCVVRPEVIGNIHDNTELLESE